MVDRWVCVLGFTMYSVSVRTDLNPVAVKLPDPAVDLVRNPLGWGRFIRCNFPGTSVTDVSRCSIGKLKAALRGDAADGRNSSVDEVHIIVPSATKEVNQAAVQLGRCCR